VQTQRQHLLCPLPRPRQSRTPSLRKRGILVGLIGRGSDAQIIRRVLDDAMLEQAEELLIASEWRDTASAA